jgi:hypothetical protein
MAFSFDSASLVQGFCALPLLGVAAFAWNAAPATRASVRLNLRFAAVLFAALGAAAFCVLLAPGLAGMDFAVACLVSALGGAALGLCVFAHLSRPPPPLAAGLALCAGLAAGLAASLTGQPVFALAAIIAASALMLALGFGCLSRTPRIAIQTILGAAALAGGGMALMQMAQGPSLLFFAAGLMGLACASRLRIEQQAGDRLIQSVSRARP